tara:strand:- start:182 stop:3382 length:3201 start_codon:yes stop_codon:yes gene_type:complete
MSNDRGVFRLGAYRRAQVEGQGVNLNDVWLPQEASKYGYMGGGYFVDSTALDKITFDTDTVARTPSTDLEERIIAAGTFTSSSAGYLVAGYTGNPADNTAVSTVRKLTYATEVFSTASPGYGPGPSGPSPNQGAYGLMGAASPTNGYIAGGLVGPGFDGNNRTRRMSFASETWDTFGATMTSQMKNLGDVIGNQDVGYWCGSNPSQGGASRMHKLTYSTETASTAGNLDGYSGNRGRSNSAGVSNATQGYLVTGASSPGPNPTSAIQKIVFATDTAVVIPSQFPVATTVSHGTGNISNGYIGGGTPSYPGGTPGNLSSVWKFDISTETASTLSSALSTAAYHKFAVSATDKASKINTELERWTDGWKGTYDGGYWAGGQSTAPGGWPAPSNEYRSSIFKVNFATDVGEISPSKLPKTMGQFHYVVADDVNGYLIGGDPSPDQEVVRVSMVSETASILPNASPSQSIRDNNDMGITYGKLYGYGQGGLNENLSPDEGVSSTAKFTFATETSGDAPAAKWSGSPAPRIKVSSVGNLTSHGYFTGGMTYKQSQPEYGKSDIAKMTYATETISEIPANLNGSYFYSATMSSETAGYITSNQYLPSWGSNQQMNKITFATDTQSLLGGASSPERSQANGTGNASAGYVGGGYRHTPASSFMTQVYKLDYATETAMSLISSNWQGDSGTRGLYRGAAFGPLSAGRAAGGVPTPTPTPGYDPGNYELASGIPNHGYYMGGNPASSMGNTNSMKMSFATDTLSTGVQLSEKYSTGGYGGGKMASSPSHAYAVYGRNPNGPGGETGNTWVRKVQYSNDTATNAPYATNEPSYAGFVAGTTTKLYYAGGIDNSNVPLGTRTNIRKLTYSNDSWATTPQSSANYTNPSGWPRNGSTSGGTPEYMLIGPSIGANDYKTTIAKFTYATDTGIMSIPGVNGDNGQAYAVGNSNDTHWYIARGQTMPGYGKQTNIGKFTFATNTYESAALVDTTNDYNSQNGTGAVNNGMIAGYWAGAHYDQQDATSTLKVTYSTDTVSRGPNIPSGRYSPSASSGGGGNAFSGTTVQEWGNGGTRVPNVV